MAASNVPGDLENIPDAVVDEENKGFPVVWLLPLVALLVGGWLIYKTMSEKGPEVEITFKTAEGIEQGKTSIKYRDVTIGKVDNVQFSDDLSHIVLTATMETGMERHLTENTRFWVVRPRIGAGGITGLGTLVSGAYIEMEPSNEGKRGKKFTGLENPPVVKSDIEGTSYQLRTDKLGSLSVGAPVYFRQFDVGEIIDYTLAEDHSHVDVAIFVRAPHNRFVRTGTHFWNVGGVNLTMDASGISLQMESLVSLMSGGIAFDTTPAHAGKQVAENGTVFTLYDNRTQTLELPITEVVTYALRFEGTVRGLSVGAPVEFRGVRIGTVKAIEMGQDLQQPDILVPVVLIDVEPQRAASYANIDRTATGDPLQEEYELEPRKRIEYLVTKGLRARLQTGSLITGQLFVDLDMFPDAEPATVTRNGSYQEIPTLPNPLEGILAGVNRIVAKLEKAELGETLTNLNELMVSTNTLVGTLEQNAPGLAKELGATIEEARKTLASLAAVTSTDGEIGNELYNALAEVTAAARSIRVMSEYLERHPDALLRGKGNNP